MLSQPHYVPKLSAVTMKSFIRLALVAITLLLIMGCSSTKSLQKYLNTHSHYIQYPLDSPVYKGEKNVTVFIDSVFFNADISDSTLVIKEKSWCLPLVFFNYWESRHHCIMGTSMIKQDLPKFLVSSMVEEANRSGQFILSTEIDSGYQLTLSIDAINAEGPYETVGYNYCLFFVYGYSYIYKAGPVKTELVISYKLKKDGEVIHEHTYYSDMTGKEVYTPSGDRKRLMKNLSISMLETTALNFQNIIETIVDDVDKRLQPSY